ncbi:unnamed protein product [Durusdinium trenchii]|uniref:Uncharacterized protein n=1 Tax=Durusdinium trenchii TaxID=1381693 RepID=A0ABP0RR19_9DINO
MSAGWPLEPWMKRRRHRRPPRRPAAAFWLRKSSKQKRPTCAVGAGEFGQYFQGFRPWRALTCGGNVSSGFVEWPWPGVVLELSKTGRGYCSDECECFAPWRGLLCDTLDAGGTTHRRNYSAAIQYIVNEDPTHLAELRHSLRNLWRHFNQKFDYPVQIFHDGLSDELRAGLVRSSSNRLWFHHLPKDFIPEPHQLPPELSVEDEHRSVSHTFSAGYRAQCRFRSGPLFEHPAVATLDYLMSLDTDSMFPREVNWDPIEAMHGNGSRVLGYSSLLVSSSAYVRGLWPAVLQFLAYEGLDLRQGRAPEHFLRRRWGGPRTTWWPTMGWWS